MRFIKNKNIIITTHELVDIDGLVSCFALNFFLNHSFKNQNFLIYFPELSKSTKNYLDNFSARFPNLDLSSLESINYSNVDVFLIVDTNNLNQINSEISKNLSNLEIPYIFIDHHYLGEKSEINNIKKENLIFEDYSSTAEIILELFRFNNIGLTIPLKTLFISAILTDSGFFRHGNNKTIQTVSSLLVDEINIQDIFILLSSDIEISVKIAKIKGLQRVKLIREEAYLIGISNISSFGVPVASMLINVGFDVAIVISKKDDQNIINTRAKKGVCITTGLHLGKILEEISDQFQESGGGHDGAASLTTNREIDTVINQILEKIKKYF